jgi:hypothetical protein
VWSGETSLWMRSRMNHAPSSDGRRPSTVDSNDCKPVAPDERSEVVEEEESEQVREN